MLASAQKVNNSLSQLTLEPVFTKQAFKTLDYGINFVSKTAHITDSKGNTIFHQENVVVPDFWSQTAINILAQKYFRKTGVPVNWNYIPEVNVPLWASRREPSDNTEFKGENDLRQVVTRLVGHWTYTGIKSGYFKHEDEIIVFQDELKYMLYYQVAAPNSPQWFNTGLWWAYGITGNENNDHWAKLQTYYSKTGLLDDIYDAGEIVQVPSSYQYPQIHACFINQVEDKLIGRNGILDLFSKEARIFKYGSGSGCNYSNIRGKGELLSGGGVSSGLLSFLRIGDTVGGAIKSGGTTRRAARSVILDCDHPDLLEFIDWKVKEEEKVQALVEGSKVLRGCDASFTEYTNHYEGDAYNTVSGQNANNSIYIADAFMEMVNNSLPWILNYRTSYQTEIHDAEYLFHKIATAAWKCGDPGLMFGSTINTWNTCRNDEEIKATNPCFEYLWFTDTACNLASLNLLRFFEQKAFNIEKFKQAVKLWTMVLDISIDMAGYPNEDIAKKTFDYRTLGLGYSNLGALLMVMGLPYDSDEGRTISADISALMTGIAYLTSAQLSERLEPFPKYWANENTMRTVLKKHWFSILPNNTEINKEACLIWGDLSQYTPSFRNAQVTVIAPTGTISLIMDCHTTGIEPDYSLVKYKELSGGGTIKIVNGCTREALSNLNYGQWVECIIDYIDDHGSMKDCPLVAPNHRKIFDCANDINPSGHLKMVAAVQPFVSGGISKTINLPNSATVKDVKNIYFDAWKQGIKCISIYRDGCKNSQPLTAKVATPKGKTNEIAKEDIHLHKVTCGNCGSENLVKTGTCMVCVNCGSNKGGCV